MKVATSGTEVVAAKAELVEGKAGRARVGVNSQRQAVWRSHLAPLGGAPGPAPPDKLISCRQAAPGSS